MRGVCGGDEGRQGGEKGKEERKEGKRRKKEGETLIHTRESAKGRAFTPTRRGAEKLTFRGRGHHARPFESLVVILGVLDTS